MLKDPTRGEELRIKKSSPLIHIHQTEQYRIGWCTEMRMEFPDEIARTGPVFTFGEAPELCKVRRETGGDY